MSSVLPPLQLLVCAPVAVPTASPLLSSSPHIHSLLLYPPRLHLSFNLHRLGSSLCNKCGGGRVTSIQRTQL